MRTNLGTSYAKREPQYGSPQAGAALGPDIHVQAFYDQVVPEDWKAPEEIADLALAGLRRGELWIITHPEMMGPVDARARGIEAAAERAR